MTSTIAGRVPTEQLSSVPWSPKVDSRRAATFTSFALTAAAEALLDAGWKPEHQTSRERTGVAIGSGMSSASDMAEAGRLLKGGQGRRISPYFIPRILVNMAAGAVSMEYGFR
ncbi:hypothetical protein CYMTET_42840 [Cymbomonas tetramitiformis]|uniref:beta-ketoacyl-[acyl-carrier-protein] synthase I n=1 Tax=Cymbomonas tetramitiformis TaxID=36881 RepID=A0AAE0C3C5_9CHLO|nr:hypothetical protein CYMTET_42840 [Cymbomonas tetramitiformis]